MKLTVAFITLSLLMVIFTATMTTVTVPTGGPMPILWFVAFVLNVAGLVMHARNLMFMLKG